MIEMSVNSTIIKIKEQLSLIWQIKMASKSSRLQNLHLMLLDLIVAMESDFVIVFRTTGSAAAILCWTQKV